MPIILNCGFVRDNPQFAHSHGMSNRPDVKIPTTNGGPVLLGSALRTHQHRGELLPKGSGHKKSATRYISFVNG